MYNYIHLTTWKDKDGKPYILNDSKVLAIGVYESVDTLFSTFQNIEANNGYFPKSVNIYKVDQIEAERLLEESKNSVTAQPGVYYWDETIEDGINRINGLNISSRWKRLSIFCSESIEGLSTLEEHRESLVYESESLESDINNLISEADREDPNKLDLNEQLQQTMKIKALSNKKRLVEQTYNTINEIEIRLNDIKESVEIAQRMGYAEFNQQLTRRGIYSDKLFNFEWAKSLS